MTLSCLQVNKFWYPRAGAEIYALGLSEALERAGVTVHVLSTRHPSNLPRPQSSAWPRYYELSRGGAALSPLARLRALSAIFYNPSAARAVRTLLRGTRVDVAHVHNFTKHLGPAVLRALAEAGVPSVATLHDYWPVCPTYSLLRGDGTVCDAACAREGGKACVRYRCAAPGLPVNLVSALEFDLHRFLGWGLPQIDRVIAPSRFLASVIGEAGVRAGQLIVVPHPRPRRTWEPPPGKEGGLRVLYVGRLAKEKGIHVLIDAARRAGCRLDVAGTGPMESELRRQSAGDDNIRFLGFLAPDQVLAAMRASHVVAVPSIWYENAPLVVLEALATGRVVAASAIGGIPEYLAGVPGARLLRPGSVEDWQRALEDLEGSASELTELGRRAWEASAAAPGWAEHAEQVRDIYRSVAR
ncbi:MAG TPA: glycosyltransferase [Candidatus Polarisedimenticolaceae bacterium]|nr:glycosyltransferase [Candidatus Polarisedimenticolaceae bacterium]